MKAMYDWNEAIGLLSGGGVALTADMLSEYVDAESSGKSSTALRNFSFTRKRADFDTIIKQPTVATETPIMMVYAIVTNSSLRQ
eukprot:2031850-Prymnesium_polylepis.1